MPMIYSSSLSRGSALLWAFAFPLLLLIAYVVFSAALGGPFVLDDQRIFSYAANVLDRPWQDHFASLRSLYELVVSRPLAMLAFRVEDIAWPTAPLPYKRDNLLLHLLNACLVFLLVYRLFLWRFRRQVLWIALTAAGLWLLHPLQLSTMMTVVQRMTLLMAMFVLLAMNLYLWGRLYVRSVPLAYVLMTAAVVLVGALAVLSKTNGALLVFYILVTEFTLLQERPRPQGYRWWASVFLGLPALGLLVALLATAKIYDAGDYVGLQRLLSQARVLWEYLGAIFVPRVGSLGIYHDDFVASASLLSPPSTLFAVVGIIALLAVGLWSIRRLPLLAFGILWFLAGHLVESTVVPLELYFEHRNYVPMIGPCIALAAMLVLKLPRWPALALVAAMLGALAVLSVSYATIWGNPALMATSWAQSRPDSARAQLHLANFLWDRGRPELAEQALFRAWQRQPRHIYLVVKALEIACSLRRSGRIDLQPLIAQAEDIQWTQPLAFTLGSIGGSIRAGACPVVDGGQFDLLVAMLLRSEPARTRGDFGFHLWLERMEMAEWHDNLDAAWASALAAERAWSNPFISVHLSRLALLRDDRQTAERYWRQAQQQAAARANLRANLVQAMAEHRKRMASSDIH